MQISRRVTNGLAWTGLLLVVGVPSADIISAQFSSSETSERVAVMSQPTDVADVVSSPAMLDSVPQTETADAPVPRPLTQRPDAPLPTQQVASSDPVETFIESGKPLPAYITDGGSSEPVAQAPRPVISTPAQPAVEPVETAIVPEPAVPATAAPDVDPIETASLGAQPEALVEARVAPVPMPLAMRPPSVARVATPAATPTEALILPEAAPQAPPVAGFTPAVPPAAVADYDRTVSADELLEWESGPLSEFLARRNGTPNEPYADYDAEYDADGFFLDEGPGSSADYNRSYRDEAPVVSVYPLYY